MTWQDYFFPNSEIVWAKMIRQMMTKKRQLFLKIKDKITLLTSEAVRMYATDNLSGAHGELHGHNGVGTQNTVN